MRKIFLLVIQVIALAALLYLQYDQHPLFLKTQEHPFTKSLVTFLIYFLGINIIRYIIILYINDRPAKNYLYGLNNIAKLLIGMGFIAFIFASFGIDINKLLTSMSIVAAAIAIISKDFVNDFLVGLSLSFTNDIEIGDYVQIGEEKGRVSEIKMLKFKLLNDNDDLVLIPNSQVYNNQIINYTKRNIRLMSIDFQVDINKVGNLEKFENGLIKSISNFAEYIENDTYKLKIVNVTKDYLDLKFQYTLKHLDQDLINQIRRKTVREVYNYISIQE